MSNTGALHCQRCPSGTVPDNARSSCLIGGVWTWSNHDNGSCKTKRQFIKGPTETNSPYRSIVILLACIAGILAITSALPNILLAVFYKKWKRRVQVSENVKEAYTSYKEVVYTKDPEGGQPDKGDEKGGWERGFLKPLRKIALNIDIHSISTALNRRSIYSG